MTVASPPVESPSASSPDVMEAPDGRGTSPDFSRPRAAGGIALLALVGMLYLADFASPDFSVDSIQLGLLLGTALLLLGVEAGRKLLR